MATKCPSCNEASVEWQGTNDSQLVCTSCGVIVQEACLISDSGLAAPSGSSSDFKYYAGSLPKQYTSWNTTTFVSEGRKLGRKAIHSYSLQLKCPDGITSEACALYQQALADVMYHKAGFEKKKQVAGACLYVVCRNHQWSVSLEEFSAVCGCSKHTLLGTVLRLIRCLNMEMKVLDMSDLVQTICKNLAEDTRKLVVELVKLCEEVLIAGGRHRSCLVKALAFIAWQSQNPVDRRKCKITDFLRKFEINTEGIQTVRCRIKEVTILICALAQELPWVTADSVDAGNFLFNVADVTQYYRTLICDAQTTLTQSSQEDTPGTATGDEAAPTNGTRTDSTVKRECQSPIALWSESGQVNEEDVKVKKEEDERIVKECHRALDLVCASDTIPVLNCKRELDSEQLGPEDISEAELAFYLDMPGNKKMKK